MIKLKSKKIKAADFDTAFDQGAVTEHFDLKSIKVCHPTQRISIDSPKIFLMDWVLEQQNWCNNNFIN